MFRFYTPSVRQVNPLSALLSLGAFDEAPLDRSAQPLLRPVVHKRHRCALGDCDDFAGDAVCDRHLRLRADEDEDEDQQLSYEDLLSLLEHAKRPAPAQAPAPPQRQAPPQPQPQPHVPAKAAAGRAVAAEQKRTVKKPRTEAPLQPFELSVEEIDKAFLVHLRAPNLKADELQVTVDKGVLTIKGQSNSESRHEEDGFSYSTTTSTSFSRAIPLPRHVDEDGIRAHMSTDETSLTVTLPKRAAAPQKSVAIAIQQPQPQQQQAAIAKPDEKERKEEKDAKSPAAVAAELPKLPENVDGANTQPLQSQVAEPRQESKSEADASAAGGSAHPSPGTPQPEQRSPTGKDKDGWTLVDA